MLSKTLKRTVVVESIYLGRLKPTILRELEEAYKEMVREAVDSPWRTMLRAC